MVVGQVSADMIDVAVRLLAFASGSSARYVERPLTRGVIDGGGLPRDQIMRWLLACPGLVLPDGQCLLGATGGPESLRIESVLESYPVFVERSWLPIADDGCGNYWVLHGDGGVAFVDCSSDSTALAYAVASGLGEFLVPFLIPNLRTEGWPFDERTALAWDAELARTDIPLPWTADFT